MKNLNKLFACLFYAISFQAFAKPMTDNKLSCFIEPALAIVFESEAKVVSIQVPHTNPIKSTYKTSYESEVALEGTFPIETSMAAFKVKKEHCESKTVNSTPFSIFLEVTASNGQTTILNGCCVDGEFH